MGVAGAGKSVQGKMLAKKIGSKWISTGELLRRELSGKRREEMIAGRLLADDEIIEVIEKFFRIQGDQNYILDGFPRTIPQANWLLEQLKAGRIKIDGVVHLKAPKEVVKERLLQRGRPDDNEAAIELRFSEYEKHTLPILDCFKKNSLAVYEIDAQQGVDTVHSEILQKAVRA